MYMHAIQTLQALEPQCFSVLDVDGFLIRQLKHILSYCFHLTPPPSSSIVDLFIYSYCYVLKIVAF